MLCDFADAFPKFVGQFLDREWGLQNLSDVIKTALEKLQ